MIKPRIPPPILFLLMGVLMKLVARSDYGFVVALPFAAVIGTVIGLAGAVVIVLALRRFSSADTTVNPLDPGRATTLVSDGIFGLSRNPMYLGLLLILVAWGIWLGSLTGFAVLLLFVVLITELQIKPEEQALRKIFSEDYAEYCKTVRRWI